MCFHRVTSQHQGPGQQQAGDAAAERGAGDAAPGAEAGTGQVGAPDQQGHR